MDHTIKHPQAKKSRAVFIVLLGVIVVMAGVHLLLQHLNLNVYSELNGRVYELSNRVDFDDEVSVPTWFSQFLFLAISASALLAAYVQKVKNARRLWFVISFITFLLAIDEAASIHELVLQTIHLLLFGETGPTIVSNAWVVLLPFIGIGAVVMLWQMVKHVPRKTVGLFAVGGVIFLCGAVGIDIITSSEVANTFYNRGILVATEESLELLGTSIVFYAIVNYLEVFYASHIKQALSQLKK